MISNIKYLFLKLKIRFCHNPKSLLRIITFLTYQELFSYSHICPNPYHDINKELIILASNRLESLLKY